MSGNRFNDTLKRARDWNPQFRPGLLALVDDILDEGNRFERLCGLVKEACTDGESGTRMFLGRWVRWNHDFAGYVAGLASACHGIDPGRLTPFAVPTHPAFMASSVFAATIDEYTQGTHAALALDFLESFFWESGDYTTTDHTKGVSGQRLYRTITRSRAGYLPEGGSTVPRIYYALGFHIASERFASLEFAVVDKVLRDLYPDRVMVCEKNDAYQWIEDHKHLEIEHFEHAVVAAELAFDGFLPELDSKGDSLGWIEQGIRDFDEVQNLFFTIHQN